LVVVQHHTTEAGVAAVAQSQLRIEDSTQKSFGIQKHTEDAKPGEPGGEAGDTPGSSYGAFTAQVLGTVADLNRATSAEIARVLSAKTKHVWQALQRLVKQGKVRQDGKDYFPT
jgi:hypothetical protein